jgi:hypothetical protein
MSVVTSKVVAPTQVDAGQFPIDLSLPLSLTDDQRRQMLEQALKSDVPKGVSRTRDGGFEKAFGGIELEPHFNGAKLVFPFTARGEQLPPTLREEGSESLNTQEFVLPRGLNCDAALRCISTYNVRSMGMWDRIAAVLKAFSGALESHQAAQGAQGAPQCSTPISYFRIATLTKRPTVPGNGYTVRSGPLMNKLETVISEAQNANHFGATWLSEEVAQCARTFTKIGDNTAENHRNYYEPIDPRAAILDANELLATVGTIRHILHGMMLPQAATVQPLGPLQRSASSALIELDRLFAPPAIKS